MNFRKLNEKLCKFYHQVTDQVKVIKNIKKFIFELSQPEKQRAIVCSKIPSGTDRGQVHSSHSQMAEHQEPFNRGNVDMKQIVNEDYQIEQY